MLRWKNGETLVSLAEEKDIRLRCLDPAGNRIRPRRRRGEGDERKNIWEKEKFKVKGRNILRERIENCRKIKTKFRKNIPGRYVGEEVNDGPGLVREDIVVPTSDPTTTCC